MINQNRCIKFKLNVNQAALMSVLTEVSSWATEKVIKGKTYWWVSRNKVIEQLPLFYEKPDTVYRHFKYLAAIGLVDYETENRRDYLRLTEKGKRWNKLGNESDFISNSEMNPSELGNESEIAKQVKVIDFKVVKPDLSEMNPTNNIITITKDKSEENDALTFLQNESPSLYETFMMKYRNRFSEAQFSEFCIKLNSKIQIEVSQRKLEFVGVQIFYRAEAFVLNYLGNENAKESKSEINKDVAPVRKIFKG
ncbi:hypothetical protein [Flavobacterium sp.]|uniref:hypothetical protein n=1 Tax=Flavobacterium sp. TaxID=239 RepID=UPI00260A43D3|nr:hypothetical protein [Flavobacterium sp.]